MSGRYRQEWVEWMAEKCFWYLGRPYGAKCVVELLEFFDRKK